MAQANSVMFMPNQPPDVGQTIPLLARVHLKLGAWRWHLNELDDESVRGNLACFRILDSKPSYTSSGI